MRQEINPNDTKRAEAFKMWMKSPMPMVTVVKTFDVTHLYKLSKQRRQKFNMLLCWCIGKAASKITEFYDLPSDDMMARFDQLAIGLIIVNSKGGINYCDIPYNDNLQKFCQDYHDISEKAISQSTNICLDSEMMVIGTSAIIQTEIDCIVNQYTKQFNNPMAMWGKYRKHWFKVTLPISFQFHHVQMDGAHATHFLEELQKTLKEL